MKCEICGGPHYPKHCKQKNNEKKKGDAFLSIAMTSSSNFKGNSNWYIDSGATSHMSFDANSVENFKGNQGHVMVADGKCIDVVGTGTVKIHPKGSDREFINLQDVMLIPDISLNLLSVHCIVQHGFTVTFKNSGGVITNEAGEVIACCS